METRMTRITNLKSIFILTILLIVANIFLILPLKAKEESVELENNLIKLTVYFEDGKIISEKIVPSEKWAGSFNEANPEIKTDADFGLDVMWTGWRAPGKINNADNPVLFTKDDFFLVTSAESLVIARNEKNLTLLLQGRNNRFLVKMSYQLGENDFYIRRKIAVRDTVFGKHFLRTIYARKGTVLTPATVEKEGGFGQPVALLHGNYGSFWGLEYPASNSFATVEDNGRVNLKSWQEIGERIGSDWIESDWTILGLTPDVFIKKWFMAYIDDIRVAELKPYTLYNSWYDIRSEVMVKKRDNKSHIMNEENTLRIIKLFRKNMVDPYGIHLDAFVLDDGWDIYKSDWVLRKKEFPNGLRPIVEELKKMGTDLGIWFGPIGGYSHRDWRIGWMKEHGYELIGDQLCFAGKNYKELFKKRVVDFVVNDSVGYYKWDGIQFSCSEPDHGHPIGIYSRRAVMESVVEMCNSVREKNPDIFLNITSGTWLSPWWVKYANTIWMQGYDFGYANVPSISRRDAAITYRDFVLYEDFHKNNQWFPIANLMTHGIIKGNLRKLGGEEEPLDKFTDNALLYLARGVAMWELYISPDLLTDKEWKALAKSIEWAKDRFPILKNTEMIGGDPGERETYGYAHFKGHNGIIAVRNPKIEADVLTVTLSPALGICPRAASLVLERVYPTRWISPQLYSAGATISLKLGGFETAVYEIYPVEEANEPLLTGVVFNADRIENDQVSLKIWEGSDNIKLLNPEQVKAIMSDGQEITLQELISLQKPSQEFAPQKDVRIEQSHGETILSVDLTIDKTIDEPVLAVLLESEQEDSGFSPELTVKLNGASVTPKIEQQKERWAWYKINLKNGKNYCQIEIKSKEENQPLLAKGFVWLIGKQKFNAKTVIFKLAYENEKRPLPPKPWDGGVVRQNLKLKEFSVGENN